MDFTNLLEFAIFPGSVTQMSRETHRKRRFEVSYQCHMNCDEWRQKVNKDRKEKVNLTTPIYLELADSRRFVSAPANCD